MRCRYSWQSKTENQKEEFDRVNVRVLWGLFLLQNEEKQKGKERWKVAHGFTWSGCGANSHLQTSLVLGSKAIWTLNCSEKHQGVIAFPSSWGWEVHEQASMRFGIYLVNIMDGIFPVLHMAKGWRCFLRSLSKKSCDGYSRSKVASMKLRAYCKPTLPFDTLDFSLGEDNSLSVSFFLPLSLLISHLSDSLDSVFSVSLFMGGGVRGQPLVYSCWSRLTYFLR